jgi:peptide/nickel transport system ATP-binding protein
MADRCYFADRCPKAMTECLERPTMADARGSDEHEARCVLTDTDYDEARALRDDRFDDAKNRTMDGTTTTEADSDD